MELYVTTMCNKTIILPPPESTPQTDFLSEDLRTPLLHGSADPGSHEDLDGRHGDGR